MLQARRYHHGYSLVELGIVLGVVAGLIVGVLFLAQTISTQNRLTQLNQFVTRAVATTIRITSLDGSITAGSNLVAVLQATGEFPDNMFTTGTNVEFTTPFSGATIAIWGVNDNRFAVYFKEMPADACFSVAQSILQSRETVHAFHIEQGVSIDYTTGQITNRDALTVATDTSADIAGECADDVELLVIYK